MLKANMITAIPENQKANSFWLSYFKKQAQYNESVTVVTTYPEIIKSITADDIKKAAMAYLNGKNEIRFVLMPEGNK
jgi:predicted Zn-dependent peptidase